MKKFVSILTATAIALSALFFASCSPFGDEFGLVLSTRDPNSKPTETYNAQAADIPDVTQDYYAPSVTAVPLGPTNAPHNPNMRNWQSIMSLPSQDKIDYHNSTSTKRSPYIAGIMPVEGSFTQYSIKFKSDYLPPATYCCLGQFTLDYSALLSEYTRVWQDYDFVSAYAGLQVQRDGQYNSIMSLWDIYCMRKDGSTVTITPSVVYPEKVQSGFGGEGEGANCLIDYNWQAGRWYEMRIIIGTSEDTGNSTIEQWILDVGADEWTYLCKYDLGVRNVKLTGDISTFLENFYPDFSGEVRTMECCDCGIVKTNGDYMPLTKVYMTQSYDYPGSYVFGVEGNTFYIITTGVNNMASELQKATLYDLIP